MLSFRKKITAILAVLMLVMFASTSFAATLTFGGDPATFSNIRQLVPRSDMPSYSGRMDVRIDFAEVAQPTCKALPWSSERPYFALISSDAQAGVCYTEQIRITNAHGGCHADTAAFGTVWGPETPASPMFGNGCRFKLNGVDYSSMVTAVILGRDTTPPMPGAAIQIDLAPNVVCTASGTPEEPPLPPAEPVVVRIVSEKGRITTGIDNWRRYGLFDNVVSLHLQHNVECHYRAK